jgi:hypothetical protein
MSIVIGAQAETFCEASHGDKFIPSTWRYGEQGPGYEANCKPLPPGAYHMVVFGGERGRAILVVGEDGAVKVDDQRCTSGQIRKDYEW